MSCEFIFGFFPIVIWEKLTFEPKIYTEDLIAKMGVNKKFVGNLGMLLLPYLK